MHLSGKIFHAMNGLGLSPVANDLKRNLISGRTRVKLHLFAREVRKFVGVAPDLEISGVFKRTLKKLGIRGVEALPTSHEGSLVRAELATRATLTANATLTSLRSFDAPQRLSRRNSCDRRAGEHQLAPRHLIGTRLGSITLIRHRNCLPAIF
jgi:hypothetical protein